MGFPVRSDQIVRALHGSWLAQVNLPPVMGSSACPLMEWFQQAQDSLVACEAGAGNPNHLHWSAQYLDCTLLYALSANDHL